MTRPSSKALSRSILVTGAAGFIGSHLVERLLARGDSVVGIDNFDPFYDRNLKCANLARAEQQPGFSFYEVDLRDREAMASLLTEHPVRAVVHLAARAGVRPSIEQPELYADINVRGSTILFELAVELGIDRIVYASSSSVYGGRTRVPFCEEDVVDHPVSPYAATKKATELMAHSFHHVYGIHAIGLRYFTVYGPRQRPEMAIHKFTRMMVRGEAIPVFGDGSSCRDYTFIDDIINGTLAALDRAEGYRVYNLGGSVTTRLLDVIEKIGQALGVTPDVMHLPEQPGDVPRTFADIARAGRELGYDPATPLEEGISRFVEWFRSRKEIAQ